jgi:hypothetical protein
MTTDVIANPDKDARLTVDDGWRSLLKEFSNSSQDAQGT